MKTSKKQSAPQSFLTALREFRNPDPILSTLQKKVRLMYFCHFEDKNIKANPWQVYYTNVKSRGEEIITKTI